MSAEQILYATGPYTDHARKLSAGPTLLHGQEGELLAAAMPALDAGDLELDLRELRQVDAAGLGVLATLHAYATQSGRTLRMTNPSPRVWQLMKMTGLDSALHKQTRCA